MVRVHVCSMLELATAMAAVAGQGAIGGENLKKRQIKRNWHVKYTKWIPYHFISASVKWHNGCECHTIPIVDWWWVFMLRIESLIQCTRAQVVCVYQNATRRIKSVFQMHYHIIQNELIVPEMNKRLDWIGLQRGTGTGGREAFSTQAKRLMMTLVSFCIAFNV